MITVRRLWALSVIPVASIIMALLVGSLLIIASSLATGESLNLLLPLVAYESLLEGATGLSLIDLNAADVPSLALSIDGERAARALTNTLAAAAPLVMTGLAVGVGFKAGLFNIGGTGQVLVGGFIAALVGGGVADQPVPVAVTLALLAGALGGAGLRVREERVVRAGVGGAVHVAADGLDAGCDEHVTLACLDGVGGHADRLERRRAVTVHRDTGHVDTGEDRGDAADVETRLSRGLPATPDDVFDLRGIELRHLVDDRADDERREIVGPAFGQAALVGPTDGGAGGRDDHGFGHGWLLGSVRLLGA